MSVDEHTAVANTEQQSSPENEPARPGLCIEWDKNALTESKERVRYTAEDVRGAMRDMGFTDDQVDDTYIGITDQRVRLHGIITRGVMAPGGITIDNEDGSRTTYKYAIGVSVAAKRGGLADPARVNKTFYHELTHVQQMIRNNGVYEHGSFNYNDPRMTEAATLIARAGLLSANLFNLAGIRLLATGAYKIPLEKLPTDVIEHLPNNTRALATVGLGVAAVATALASVEPFAHMNRYVFRAFHWLNQQEQEANQAGQRLGSQHPVFEIMPKNQ